MVKVLMIGHFSPQVSPSTEANSPAGNQVQHEILKELENELGISNVCCYSMQPVPSWPKGSLFIKMKYEERIVFPSFINIALVKNIIFSINIVCAILRFKPRICLQYNSYFFENIALILYRFFASNVKVAAIIQDIHCSRNFHPSDFFNPKAMIEKFSVFIACKFDLLIPISQTIALDFQFKADKYFVFQGGITRFSKELMSFTEVVKEDFAVFAGALEPYNGIDALVEQWIRQDIRYPLHIFGRGSLADQLQQRIGDHQFIVYHGFESETVIQSWQKKARWNFCLRYSISINQDYFFPSKFFNLVCAEGCVITNHFNGLPTKLLPYLNIVEDDLSNLSSVLHASTFMDNKCRADSRRAIIVQDHNWGFCIRKLLFLLNSKSVDSSR